MGCGTPSSLAFIVEYNGRRYHGFQWQSGVPTVQSELERAIGNVSKWSSRVVAASRTDTGVHAKGQVVGFRVESRLGAREWVRALNAHLPQDIVVTNGYRVTDDFRIRKGAVS
ncbi:MAG: tRNA pseudouridine(38-40) synthase TruA, partial [Chloroflexota bacterium]